MKQLTIPMLVETANQNAELIGNSMKMVRKTIDRDEVCGQPERLH